MLSLRSTFPVGLSSSGWKEGSSKKTQDKDYISSDWNVAARGLALNFSKRTISKSKYVFRCIVIWIEGFLDSAAIPEWGLKYRPHLAFRKMLQQVWLELVISLLNDVISRHLNQVMNRSLCHASSNQTVNYVWPQKNNNKNKKMNLSTNLLSSKFLPQDLNLLRLQLLEQRADLTAEK